MSIILYKYCNLLQLVYVFPPCGDAVDKSFVMFDKIIVGANSTSSLSICILAYTSR